MDETSLAINKDFERGREPKILYLDLEISPMLAWTYSAYESNALSIKKQPQIVSFAYQWDGEKKIHVRTLPDYEGYKPGVSRLNDKKLVFDLYDLMNEADVIVGHNIKRFDIKHAKARFIYHGLKPTKRFLLEDTLFMARKYFKFPKNNLDELCERFGIGTKSKVKHSDVIWDCIEGDEKAWKLMGEYNKQDIKLTRDLYKKIAPWHETHTNLNAFWRKEQGCPTCGSEKVVQRGYRYLANSIKHRFSCNKCGKWWTGGRIDKDFERLNQSNP